jgi:2,4-dienoyl-CoA reductase-like NADH-dependent reductase (Old Yellow Enzyme family)
MVSIELKLVIELTVTKIYNNDMSKSNDKSILFSPIKIGSIEIPNRFVRSATHEFMAEDDGTPTGRLVDLYGNLAAGGVGLIITGHAYVHPLGKASPRQTGIYDDRFVAGLRLVTEAVHTHPSRIFLQIAHAGRQTKPRLAGGTPVSPSPVYDPSVKLEPRELAGAEIRALIEDFVKAAQRAKEAGFDGVQLHMAHGYLLSSFISPHVNRRTDEWGGSLENRARMALDIVRGIKATNGAEFPLIVKLNSTDFLPDGLQLEDSVGVARMLEAAGTDGIEVSGGMAESGRGSVWIGLRAEEDEGYFVGNAARIKAAVRIPVFGLGGNRTFAVMERFVAEGKVDLVSLSRPLIRDPDLIRKFRAGEISKSECISCNKCFNPRGISCGDLKEGLPRA